MVENVKSTQWRGKFQYGFALKDDGGTVRLTIAYHTRSKADAAAEKIREVLVGAIAAIG